MTRRRKKLLDDLKDRRGYSHMKEEALDRTMWRNRFGGGFEPVVRQNTEWMNEYNNSYSMAAIKLEKQYSLQKVLISSNYFNKYKSCPVEGDGWSVSRLCRFTSRKDKRYPFNRKLDRPRGRSGCVRKISPPSGSEPQTAQPVASPDTDYAIRAANSIHSQAVWGKSCSFWRIT